MAASNPVAASLSRARLRPWVDVIQGRIGRTIDFTGTEASKLQTVGIFASGLRSLYTTDTARESHACFLTHRREDGVEGRGRVVAGCGAENGQKKHGCITDNTTLCRHRRPTLLSVTRAISPRPPVNEVHRRQREPTSGLPAFFPGYTATSKEFCVVDANQSLLRLLLLIFFFLSRS